MRILLLGVAAIGLSGCSWLGGHGGYYSPQSGGHGYYPAPQADTSGECCDSYSKWNLEGAVGIESMVGGNFTTPNDVAVLPGLTSNDVSMDSAYKDGTRYELGLSKALNPNRKLTLMGSYSEAEGKDLAIASLAGTPDNVLRGKASDYKAYGVEAGLRQYFKPAPAPLVKALRPYVEGRIGAAKVDDISLTNLRDNVGAINGGTVGMYEGGWVATAAGLVGVEAPIFKQATLGLETGIRYRSELSADRTDINPTGAVGLVSGINNGSENWSVPVMLRGRYRF